MPLTQQDKQAIADIFAAAFTTGIAPIEQRLTSLEVRLTGVETRLTSFEARLTSVESRLTSFATRLTSLEARFEQFADQLDVMNQGITDALTGYHDTKTYNHRLKTIETSQRLQKRVLHEHSQLLAKLLPS